MAEPSRMARELSRAVAAAKPKRIAVDDLLDRAQAFEPSLLGDPDGLSRFRGALDELVADGQITFPAAGSKNGWDTRSQPPIPLWVLRTGSAGPARSRPAPRVWPHALENAGRIADRDDEHRLLERIAEWLRNNSDPVPVPVQERSAELFGDEKALDRYARTRLFTTGALSLDLLACHEPPLPFASQHIAGAGPTRLLVLENLATYTSFLTAVRDLPARRRPDLHLAWGHGGEFSRSVLSVPLLAPPPQELYYFGDLDLAGLRVAATAAATAAANGLPRLRPATACYTHLLAGERSWRRPDASNSGTATDPDAICEWLPSGLRPSVRYLLNVRLRIPQERLGLETLRAMPELLRTFDGEDSRRGW
jgi:hypothetical protein